MLLCVRCRNREEAWNELEPVRTAARSAPLVVHNVKQKKERKKKKKKKKT
jgi:hypothetical protein